MPDNDEPKTTSWMTIDRLKAELAAARDEVKALQDEVERLRGGLEQIRRYVEGHDEPGHECVLCLIEALAKEQG